MDRRKESRGFLKINIVYPIDIVIPITCENNGVMIYAFMSMFSIFTTVMSL